MSPLFHCELFYVRSKHLNQIYHGFDQLRKKGIIRLSFRRVKNKNDFPIPRLAGNRYQPLLQVIIDGRYSVIFDTLDGLNWIEGSHKANLAYFKSSVNADFYFKRSFSNEMFQYKPKDCQIYPLGLNYTFAPEIRLPRTLKESIVDTAYNNALVAKLYKKKFFNAQDFEYYPTLNKEPKILFLTRLHETSDAKSEEKRIQRERINEKRIRCIKVCRQAFRNQFTGGLTRESPVSRDMKELIVSRKFTRKDHFIKFIKAHDICVATTGLHRSIGWSFAEFIAASRGIVTQPLNYRVPGNFEDKKNYLSYHNEEELISKIQYLIDNRDALSNMMQNNYQYYNNYVRSDSLVLNALLKVYQNI